MAMNRETKRMMQRQGQLSEDGTPKGSQTFVCYMDAEGAVSQVTHVEEAPGSRRSDLVLQLREPALGDDSLQQRAARHDDDPAIAPAVDDEP